MLTNHSTLEFDLLKFTALAGTTGEDGVEHVTEPAADEQRDDQLVGVQDESLSAAATQCDTASRYT